MRPDYSHVPDRELLQSADGELSARRAADVRAHLDACWQCRARMRELDRTIGEFIALHNESLNARIGPGAGPRALLRARLSQLAEMPAARSPWASVPVVAALFSAIVALLIVFGGTVSAEGPRPKLSLTPGETRPVTLAELCNAVQDTGIPLETQRQVFAAYGMSNDHAANYEVDYLITPELGGARTLRNLWPQPYSARWNARVKDKLEQRLHHLVCAGKLELATAQHDISTDWIGAYRKYVGAVDSR
jgi:hypothetical protein